MNKRRSTYTPKFKAKVALEAVRGGQSQAALARHPNLNGEVVSHWRQQLVDHAGELFAGPNGPFRGASTYR